MSSNPAHSDQVGSLQRPPSLLKAREQFKNGEITKAELTLAEDGAILDALEHQQNIGIGVLSDGEFRRDAWATDVSDSLDGFGEDYPVRATTMPDGTIVDIEYHKKPIVSKLTQRRRFAQHESTFLAEHAKGLFKTTLPSPNHIADRPDGEYGDYYKDRHELLVDLVPIYQNELRALVAEGVKYIQLDQTINRFSTPESRDELIAVGKDPEKMIADEVAVDNECFDVLADAGVTTARHFCRGSRTVMRGEGDYEWFAERVFPYLHVDRFLLEYDSELAGGFAPLRFIPKGKTVVLGLVTSKYPDLEDQDLLMHRIEEATEFVDIEQLSISPQCGFGGSAKNNFMNVDEQWKKLENMVAVANRVWGA